MKRYNCYTFSELHDELSNHTLSFRKSTVQFVHNISSKQRLSALKKKIASIFWDHGVMFLLHSLFKGGSCYPCSMWRFPSKYHFFQIPNYHKDELVLLKICNDLIFEKHKKVEFLHEMGGKSPKQVPIRFGLLHHLNNVCHTLFFFCSISIGDKIERKEEFESVSLHLTERQGPPYSLLFAIFRLN